MAWYVNRIVYVDTLYICTCSAFYLSYRFAKEISCSNRLNHDMDHVSIAITMAVDFNYFGETNQNSFTHRFTFSNPSVAKLRELTYIYCRARGI